MGKDSLILDSVTDINIHDTMLVLPKIHLFVLFSVLFIFGIYLIRIPGEEDARNWVVSTSINGANPGMSTVARSGSGAPLFNVNTWIYLGRRDFGFTFVVYRK